MTTSATNIPQRVKKLEAALDKILETHNAESVIGLHHEPGAFVMEDEWVHLVVAPQTKGVGAYEFVRELGAVEDQLRKQTDDAHVLVVPAIGD
jgi:phosphopantetheine adenylyltransferase